MKPETVLQISIVEALSMLCQRYGFLFFSVPNESYMLAATAKGYMAKMDSARLMNLKKMGMTPGVSDLVVMSRGRAYCMEVKAGDGEQSTNQYLFSEWCARCGVPYAIARSVDGALAQLKVWGVIG